MSYEGWKESELGLIPNNWTVKQIKEIGEVIGGGTPSTKKKEYYDGNIAWITPKDLSGYTNRYIYKGERSITEEGLKNSSAKLLPKGTVLFTSRAPIGYVAIAGNELATNQGFRSIVCNSSIIDNLFLYYNLKYNRDHLEQLANGSTFKEISGSTLKEFKIKVPPLSEQKAIAKILTSLDEKIELNNQINQDLEEMAQAIFRSWFVDFEPFQDGEFVESELGPIPKGWRIGCLSEIAKNERRSVSPNSLQADTPYIGLEHMPRKSISLGNWGYAGQVESNKFKFYKGEILFGKLRPYFHKVGVAPVDGICSSDIIVISTDMVWFGYVLCLVSSSEFIEYANAVSTGTRMPRVSWKDMEKYKVILPPEDLAIKFTEIIGSIVNKIQLNIHENRTLATLRDTLLPKLMSGKIRVPMTSEGGDTESEHLCRVGS